MKVLSLFDGISCAQQSLTQNGIKIEYYYASEIEKDSIQITQANFPNTIQLGDVTKINHASVNYTNIDLLIGGSPCQDLSMAGKQTGLSGERSKLFYEYVRILKEIKPKYFLLENVASMKDKDKDIISDILGVQPVYINSGWFCPQQRQRYYWTNIPVNYELLEHIKNNPNKNTIQDILSDGFDQAKDIPSNIYIRKPSGQSPVHYNGNLYPSRGQAGRLMLPTGKSCPLQKEQAYGSVTNGRKYRPFTAVECERLQGLPDGYTASVTSEKKRKEAIGNGFTVPVIQFLLKNL